jgi:hypothetical protein
MGSRLTKRYNSSKKHQRTCRYRNWPHTRNLQEPPRIFMFSPCKGLWAKPVNRLCKPLIKTCDRYDLSKRSILYYWKAVKCSHLQGHQKDWTGTADWEAWINDTTWCTSCKPWGLGILWKLIWDSYPQILNNTAGARTCAAFDWHHITSNTVQHVSTHNQAKWIYIYVHTIYICTNLIWCCQFASWLRGAQAVWLKSMPWNMMKLSWAFEA